MNKVINTKTATCAVNISKYLYTSRKQVILNYKFNLNNICKRKRKWKDHYDTKIKKSKKKRQRLENEQSSSSSANAVKCKPCSGTEYSSARSKSFKNHKLTLNETLEKYLGKNFEHHTRKVYLKSVIRPYYKNIFVEKVATLNKLIRNIVFCSQIFVDAYIVRNQESTVTQQNF